MGIWGARPALRGALLLLAFSALVLHVCAHDADAHETPAPVTAVPGHAHPAEASGLHGASCQGLKPDPIGAVASTAGLCVAPIAPAVGPPSELGLPPAPARRSPLYLLHASLRI